MGKSRESLRLVANEMFAVLKSMTGIAVMIGGGLIPFFDYFFKFVQSPWLSVIAALITVVVFQLIVIFRLGKKAASATWCDRTYILLRSRWRYTLDDNLDTLSGEYEGERHLTCLNHSIAHLNITVNVTESLILFDPNENYDIVIYPESKRDKAGTISFRQPHKKEGASFAFRIDFNPPLTQGETVYIKFRYRLPHFKVANMELLRDKASKAKLDVRDYEYNQFEISYDIQKFVYELIFDSSCMIKPRGIEVKRGTDIFMDEYEKIISNNWFRCEQNDGAWKMIFERRYPPEKAVYRIKWAPPSKEELSIQTSLPKRNS